MICAAAVDKGSLALQSTENAEKGDGFLDLIVPYVMLVP